MATPSTSHKDYKSIGHTLEPWGYLQTPSPPQDWSVIIDGHKISPHVIQKTLRKCHAAGVDMFYIAQRLNVGIASINLFMSRQLSIPRTIAERFYQFFSTEESFPRAKDPTAIWRKAPEPILRKPPTFADRPPDFDAQALATAVLKERQARQWSKARLASKAKCSETYIYLIESGHISYRLTRPQPLFRICEILGLDITKYERNPRVDFKLFQHLARDRAEVEAITWPELSKMSDVPISWIRRYLSQKRPRAGVSYLDSYIAQIMATLNLDLQQILLTKKEDMNAKI